jgi:hypothetical protein
MFQLFQTQRFMLACLTLFLGVGLGVLIANQIEITIPESEIEVFESVTYDATVRDFKNGLAVFLNIKHQRSLEESTPDTLMGAFPALIPADFHGVATTVGHYEYKDGELTYTNIEIVDGAADVISDAGMKTLRDNIYRRLGLVREMNIIDVVDRLTKKPVSSFPQDGDTATSSEQAICTLDAKVCPDGTAVGRVGSNCEFAPCSTESPTDEPPITCTPEQRGAEVCMEMYAPVCASVQIQCVTTPCEPIPKTFSNNCFACREQSVDSYTQGECATQQ